MHNLTRFYYTKECHGALKSPELWDFGSIMKLNQSFTDVMGLTPLVVPSLLFMVAIQLNGQCAGEVFFVKYTSRENQGSNLESIKQKKLLEKSDFHIEFAYAIENQRISLLGIICANYPVSQMRK